MSDLCQRNPIISFTTGYGEITPTTPAGQGFCILFCLIGIPLALAALKATGELLSFGFCRVIQLWERVIIGNTVVKNLETKCAVVAFIVMLLYLALTSVVSMFVDKTGVVESFYSSFITFTTIGFGDYIPFSKVRKKAIDAGEQGTVLVTVGSAFATIISIFGLGIVSSVLNSLLSAIYVNRKKKRRKYYCLKNKPRRNEDSLDVNLHERENKHFLSFCLQERKIKASNFPSRRNSV